MANAMPIGERFWSKVDKSGECWLWTGKITRDGYGCFTVHEGGKTKFHGAHRIAYILENGSIPDGMDIDHTCFVRACVRPDHLRLATRAQNLQNRRGAQANSKSGIRGVWQCKTTGKWIARVRHNGKYHFVGKFDSIAEAECAVRDKRIELFTHNAVDRAS